MAARASEDWGDGIWPFVGAGTAAVVVGGCVAAAASAAGSSSAAWAAAYLVLVTGVAQVALGVGQGLFSRSPVPPSGRSAQLVCWNLGSAAVLGGALGQVEAVLVGGGVLLLAALALFARSAWHWAVRHRWLQAAYGVLVVLLAVSVPIGVVLGRAP